MRSGIDGNSHGRNFLGPASLVKTFSGWPLCEKAVLAEADFHPAPHSINHLLTINWANFAE
jgi:hypothetical protein